ncbi:hypothetical protein NGRA_0033 [Nosema granulosis]|uniref:Uncharacterized protein n=1 Tax=Nosema granulosis TaxID=83296 RepID=A0A9P6H162_9MICR|nr:hypothetical protein NGRA_0033 [Nosema granulosis]
MRLNILLICPILIRLCSVTRVFKKVNDYLVEIQDFKNLILENDWRGKLDGIEMELPSKHIETNHVKIEILTDEDVIYIKWHSVLFKYISKSALFGDNIVILNFYIQSGVLRVPFEVFVTDSPHTLKLVSNTDSAKRKFCISAIINLIQNHKLLERADKRDRSGKHLMDKEFVQSRIFNLPLFERSRKDLDEVLKYLTAIPNHENLSDKELYNHVNLFIFKVIRKIKEFNVKFFKNSGDDEDKIMLDLLDIVINLDHIFTGNIWYKTVNFEIKESLTFKGYKTEKLRCYEELNPMLKGGFRKEVIDMNDVKVDPTDKIFTIGGYIYIDAEWMENSQVKTVVFYYRDEYERNVSLVYNVF